MSIRNWSNIVGRQYVTITTVDPRIRYVEGRLKDGGTIQIELQDTPGFFRWPKEGEIWSIMYQGTIPYLCEYREGLDAGIPIESLLPGESRIDTDKLEISGDLVIQGKITANEVVTTEPGGTPGSDLYFVHNQIEPSSHWVITHDLGKYPSVTIVDSGGTVQIGDISYSGDQVIIDFDLPFGGKAYLN